jgi:imidazole glycerol phosphate synthase subunit hisF (EC 4.1.3.-)
MTDNKLAKRIIPCLDIQNGLVSKGIKFQNVKEIGNPIEIAMFYESQGADELVLYDINASVEMRSNFLGIVTQVANKIRIPFTVGGGIRTVDDVYNALLSGADKVSINSAAVLTPEVLSASSKRFGNQCIVASLDIKKVNREYMVFTHGGRNQTSYKAVEWAKRCEALGAGELVINAIDQDGVKKGYDIELLKMISRAVGIPVIASGGAGNQMDFINLFEDQAADAALAASVFHFGSVEIPILKKILADKGIVVRTSI